MCEDQFNYFLTIIVKFEMLPLPFFDFYHKLMVVLKNHTNIHTEFNLLCWSTIRSVTISRKVDKFLASVFKSLSPLVSQSSGGEG